MACEVTGRHMKALVAHHRGSCHLQSCLRPPKPDLGCSLHKLAEVRTVLTTYAAEVADLRGPRCLVQLACPLRSGLGLRELGSSEEAP